MPKNIRKHTQYIQENMTIKEYDGLVKHDKPNATSPIINYGNVKYRPETELKM